MPCVVIWMGNVFVQVRTGARTDNLAQASLSGLSEIGRGSPRSFVWDCRLGFGTYFTCHSWGNMCLICNMYWKQRMWRSETISLCRYHQWLYRIAKLRIAKEKFSALSKSSGIGGHVTLLWSWRRIWGNHIHTFLPGKFLFSRLKFSCSGECKAQLFLP